MSRGDAIRWHYWERALRAVEVVDGCWIWPNTNGRGYGYFGDRRAHREVWEFLVGPLPEGMVLDHGCRTTACVNPAHLEPVTQAVNMQRRHDAKLDADAARAIRESSESSGALAARYGVTPGMIWRVRTGRSWA